MYVRGLTHAYCTFNATEVTWNFEGNLHFIFYSVVCHCENINYFYSPEYVEMYKKRGIWKCPRFLFIKIETKLLSSFLQINISFPFVSCNIFLCDCWASLWKKFVWSHYYVNKVWGHYFIVDLLSFDISLN